MLVGRYYVVVFLVGWVRIDFSLFFFLTLRVYIRIDIHALSLSAVYIRNDSLDTQTVDEAGGIYMVVLVVVWVWGMYATSMGDGGLADAPGPGLQVFWIGGGLKVGFHFFRAL